MAPLGIGSSNGKGGLRQSGDDAFQLTVDYVKQETLVPLKGIGKFLLWGVAGSIVIGFGVLLLLLGVLRLLQDETGTALSGDLSWVPYLVVSVLGAGVIGVAFWRITAGPGERKLDRLEATRAAQARAESEAAAWKGTSQGKTGTEEG